MATVNLGRIKPVFKGAYNNATAYVVDDIVTSGGSSYICIQASTGNAVSNATYWTLMAQGGTDVGTTLTTEGDILYRDGSGLQRLAKGTASQVLAMNGAANAPEWVAASGGAYVKVRATQFVQQTTHGSNSYVATFLTDSITPASTSNKIIITGHLGGCEVSSAAGSMHLRLYRQINSGGYSSIAQMEGGYLGYHAPNGFAKSFAIIDTPNTTNQVDYKLYMLNEGNGGTVRIGGSSAISTIILQEVDGNKYA